MANPVIISSINEWEWTQVAVGVTAGRIYKIERSLYYYQTHRETLDPPPAAPTIGTVPEEAIRMFGESNTFDIWAPASADIYVMCANIDNDSADDIGKVRVDL